MQTGVQLSKAKTADSLSPRAPGNAPSSSNPIASIKVPLPSTPATTAGAGPSLVEKHAEIEQPEVQPAEAPQSDAVAVVRISRRQIWMAASAVCALGLLVAGGLYLRTAGRSKDVTVALTAKRTADGLEVSWDRNASVFTAQGALLMIREGELQKDLYLDLPQLRTGHVLYTPQSSDDLHLRMEVFAASEKAATQSMVLLGKAQPNPASANGAPAAETPAQPLVAAQPAAAAGRTPVPAAPAPSALPAAITLTTPTVSVPALPPMQARPEPRQFELPPAQTAASSAVAAVAPPEVDLPVLPNNAQGNIPRAIGVDLTPTPALPAPPVANNPKPAGEVTSDPRAILKVMPVIPADAKHYKGSGMEVAVRVKIDPDGRVVEATVQDDRSSAAKILGKLAVDAARQWRFDPARRGDRKIYADMVLRFKF